VELKVAFTTVLREDDLWQGETLGIEVRGRRLVVLNVAGQVCAYDDRCPHQGWPLSRGALCGQELTCALHRWRYDARTGAGINPDGVALRSYAVRVVGGDIMVDLDGDAA
jgi:toluene monooxygenase system ferredoxin subunit